MAIKEKYGRCAKCEYAQYIGSVPFSWSFIGCYYGTNHGKWVAEIKQCPRELMGQENDKGERVNWNG